MWSTHLLPSFPGPLWTGLIAHDRVLSLGQIELCVYLCSSELFEKEQFSHLNCVLMRNYIVSNRTIFTFKLRTYAKLNCLK